MPTRVPPQPPALPAPGDHGHPFCVCVCTRAPSCLTLCGPKDRSLARLLCPRNFPGKNTGVGCHFLLQCMKVKSQSEVTQSCLTLSDPMDGSPPGSSVHGSRQPRILECVTTIYMSNVSNCTLKQIYFIEYKPYPNKTDLKYVLRDKFCILNECLSKTSGE